MSTRDRRQKASEVVAGQLRPFVRMTGDFRKEFPMVEEVRMEVVSRFDTMGQKVGEYRGRYPLAEFIDWSNLRCYNGGVRIALMVRFMVERQQTEDRWVGSCQGYEGSPKGRRNYGPCDNRFEVTVTIRYKAEES